MDGSIAVGVVRLLSQIHVAEDISGKNLSAEHILGGGDRGGRLMTPE